LELILKLQTSNLKLQGNFKLQTLNPELGVWSFSEVWSLMFGICCLACASGLQAQPLTFSTLAGYAGPGSADGTGAAARFANPWGVAADSAGNLYVADTDNHTIRKITAGGVVSTLAGAAGVSGSADGTNGSALFSQPQGLAVDGAGNLYVADTGNYTIRKITPAGVVTTLAGSAGTSGTNDGTGSSARFYEPEGVAVTSDGSLIYVADTWNHTIRQITPGGVVTTLAGTAGSSGTNDGTGGSAQFNQPTGLAVDGAGNVYVGDTGNQTIRKVTAGGVVTTPAGSAGNYGTNDATGSSARFWDPQGVALDSATNLYVADSFNHTIRKVTPAGVVSTLAGTAGSLGSADGTGAAARFWLPQGVAVDGSGNVYVADSANGTIRMMPASAVVATVAGSASTGSANGTGSSARFYWPSGAAIDSGGNSFVADTGNGTIRTITAAGVASTLAGLAGNFGSTDGSSTNARFYGPQGVEVDGSGNAYVADTGNHTIRKITSGGVVSTLVGLAGSSGLTDGTGSNARFNGPQGVTVDSSGNVYVADTWNHTIRKVTSGGVVSTLAGLPGTYGDIDGTSAGGGTNTARFYCPSGIAVDSSGNVYVADTRNHTIRKVTPAGAVSTPAGLPGVWGSADGTNSTARFYQPVDLTVDVSGNLYVLDAGNQTVRMVAPMGTNWVVTTVAGQAGVTGSADGTGSNARFFYPGGIGINSAGSFCVADLGNNTIRAGVSSVNSSPSILTQPQNQTANQGQNASFSVTATGSAPLSYQWLFYGTNLIGATATSYTVSNAQPANAGPYSVVVSNSLGMISSSNALLTIIVPPTITNQPQSLTINQGMNATFTVGASGTSPFSYQWVFNGTNIPGATASSYTKTNAQPSDSGNYSVAVSNPAGTGTSSNAVLTVNPVPTPPGIATQPQDQTVGQGTNATFTVTASGSTPFSYQWLFYGTNLPGATAPSYTVTNSQPANAGPYSVTVTNLYGSTNSATATLTVILPPVISVQPASELAAVSNSVTFNVGLSQGASASYQWRQNGADISGATQSSYTIPSVLWASAGSYSVVVSNFAASLASSNAVLTVEQAAFSFFDGFESYNLGALDNDFSGPNATSSNPWWALSSTTQGGVTNSSTGVTPHGGSKMAGRSAGASFQQDYINLMYRLNDGLRNDGRPYWGNFMCQWWFYDPWGTNNLPNATNYTDYLALGSYAPVQTNSDTIASTTIYQRMSLGAFNASGFNVSCYQARILGGSGSFGSGNSWYNTATLRSVGWHHARVVVGIPSPATLLAPVSMYVDNMTNATVTSPVDGTNNVVFPGFNVIEMNHASSTTSGYYDDLTFRAANDPWIIEQPVSQSVNAGQAALFNTVAVGTAYQWQFNGTTIAGATTSAYGIASAAATNAGNYACVISGTNGTITTSLAALTVISPPSIVTPPSSLTVTQNQNATFSVTAAGASPLNYQWRFNSAPISGATASSYTVTNAQTTSAGGYSVLVTNAAGSATSAVATLTVLVPPSISVQPQSQTIASGNCATFSVMATGTAPLYYQWRWNGAPQATGTASSYNACAAGDYSVLVSNVAGTVLSDTATLIFTNPPAAQPGHFDSLALLPNGSLQLNMSGTAYTNYVLEFTGNWASWSPLTILSSPSGLFEYNDPSPATNSERFYRLRVGP
jgi:sugar lactone lactonase YvrE